MISIWLDDTSDGSSIIGNVTMQHLPRIGDTLIMEGKRYCVKNVVHVEIRYTGYWNVYVIVGNIQQ